MGFATGGSYFNSTGRWRVVPAAGGPSTSAFKQAVLRRVRAVPEGRVTTYGDVADAVGRPGAGRAVGRVLGAGDAEGVPYHRVVAAGGRVAGGGARERARRLRAEGLRLTPEGRVARFAKVRWP
jgi:O-6-methylguanine DNA methyltransferase